MFTIFLRKLILLFSSLLLLLGAFSFAFINIGFNDQKSISSKSDIKLIPNNPKRVKGSNDFINLPINDSSNEESTLKLSDLFHFLSQEIPIKVNTKNYVDQNIVLTLKPSEKEKKDVISKIFSFVFQELDQLDEIFSDENLAFPVTEWTQENIFMNQLKLFLTGDNPKPSRGWTDEQMDEIFSMELTTNTSCITYEYSTWYIGVTLNCVDNTFHGNLNLKLSSITKLLFSFLKNLWQKLDSESRDEININFDQINDQRILTFNQENVNLFIDYFQKNPRKLEQIIEQIIVDSVKLKIFVNKNNSDEYLSLIDTFINNQFGDAILNIVLNRFLDIGDLIEKAITSDLIGSLIIQLQQIFDFLFLLSSSQPKEVISESDSINEDASSPSSVVTNILEETSIDVQQTDLLNTMTNYLFVTVGTETSNPSVPLSSLSFATLFPFALQFLKSIDEKIVKKSSITSVIQNQMKEIIARHSQAFFDHLSNNIETEFKYQTLELSNNARLVLYVLNNKIEENHVFAFSWFNESNSPFTAWVKKSKIEETVDNSETTYELIYFAQNHWTVKNFDFDFESPKQNIPEAITNLKSTFEFVEENGIIIFSSPFRKLIIDTYADNNWQLISATETPTDFSNIDWKNFDEFNMVTQTVEEFLNSLTNIKIDDSFVWNEDTQIVKIDVIHNGWTFTVELDVIQKSSPIWTVTSGRIIHDDQSDNLEFNLMLDVNLIQNIIPTKQIELQVAQTTKNDESVRELLRKIIKEVDQLTEQSDESLSSVMIIRTAKETDYEYSVTLFQNTLIDSILIDANLLEKKRTIKSITINPTNTNLTSKTLNLESDDPKSDDQIITLIQSEINTFKEEHHKFEQKEEIKSWVNALILPNINKRTPWWNSNDDEIYITLIDEYDNGIQLELTITYNGDWLISEAFLTIDTVKELISLSTDRANQKSEIETKIIEKFEIKRIEEEKRQEEERQENIKRGLRAEAINNFRLAGLHPDFQDKSPTVWNAWDSSAKLYIWGEFELDGNKIIEIELTTLKAVDGDPDTGYIHVVKIHFKWKGWWKWTKKHAEPENLQGQNFDLTDADTLANFQTLIKEELKNLMIKHGKSEYYSLFFPPND